MEFKIKTMEKKKQLLIKVTLMIILQPTPIVI